MRKVLTYGAAPLRWRADPVFVYDEDLGLLIDEMTAIMRASEGIGLSANQIGARQNVCVIGVKETVIEMVNPQVYDAYEPIEVSEACLSIPGWADKLDRWGVVVGVAQDRDGKTFKFRATHLTAQIVQHEIDHLGGIMFTDRVLNNDFDGWLNYAEGIGE